MKKFIVCTFALICITVLTGCNNTVANSSGDNTSSFHEIARNPAAQEEQMNAANRSKSASLEKNNEQSAHMETIEYGYNNLYLSITIPNGWNHKIKTAEDMAKEDGLIICAIEFWPEEYPEAVFEFGYMTSFIGMCATGVTIEDFTLSGGLSGYSYMEEGENHLWLTILFNNPDGSISDGTYLINASPELSVWENIKPDFEKILDSVRITPLSDENNIPSGSSEN